MEEMAADSNDNGRDGSRMIEVAVVVTAKMAYRRKHWFVSSISEISIIWNITMQCTKRSLEGGIVSRRLHNKSFIISDV
jgi:hypothetical protein